MHKLRDMLEKELHAITDKGELSAGSLDIIDKLTHSIKSIDTIMAMEGSSHDEGYSTRKRDSMGRYSRDEYRGHSYDGYSRRGYYEPDDDRVKDWMRQMEK